jgi:hypothetical protein
MGHSIINGIAVNSANACYFASIDYEQTVNWVNSKSAPNLATKYVPSPALFSVRALRHAEAGRLDEQPGFRGFGVPLGAR